MQLAGGGLIDYCSEREPTEMLLIYLIKLMPIAKYTESVSSIHFVLMVRPLIEPGCVSHQGSEANTFTAENSWGVGFSTEKGAAPATSILKLVTDPVLICDTNMVDHLFNGSSGMMSLW